MTGTPTFRTQQNSTGETVIQFGDGVEGRRVPSGDGSISAHYRAGEGVQMQTCPQCDHKQKAGSFKCERCGAYLKRF
jgi:hypothetical protein